MALVVLQSQKGKSRTEAFRRTQAWLRCTVASLAAERFRLRYQRWPQSLEELVEAKLLATVPLDPCDGATLRLRRIPDGVMIYSVGYDGRYLFSASKRLYRYTAQVEWMKFLEN